MVIKILFSSSFTEKIRNIFLLLVLRIFTLFQRVETVFLIKTIKKILICLIKVKEGNIYSAFFRRKYSSALVNDDECSFTKEYQIINVEETI